MIPTDWRAYRRDDDGELLGYIAPMADGFQPRTIFGYPLGSPCDEGEAELRLDSLGLGYLAERWLLKLDDYEDLVAVQLIEASPTAVTVSSVDFGAEIDWDKPITLDAPVDPQHLMPARRLVA